MDKENRLENNPIQKIYKTMKNQSQIAACEQKTTSEKAYFKFLLKHRFSSTLQWEQTNFTPQDHSLFRSTSFSAWPKSLLQFDFKNHENVWTDLKKKTALQYNSKSLKCKKESA